MHDRPCQWCSAVCMQGTATLSPAIFSPFLSPWHLISGDPLAYWQPSHNILAAASWLRPHKDAVQSVCLLPRQEILCRCAMDCMYLTLGKEIVCSECSEWNESCWWACLCRRSRSALWFRSSPSLVIPLLPSSHTLPMKKYSGLGFSSWSAPFLMMKCLLKMPKWVMLVGPQNTHLARKADYSTLLISCNLFWGCWVNWHCLCLQMCSSQVGLTCSASFCTTAGVLVAKPRVLPGT